ncbi:MAG: thioesterase II family protein [Desulfovibrio sp.]
MITQVGLPLKISAVLQDRDLGLPISTAKSTTLFCIPHAGGSAAYYTHFGNFFSNRISFEPLELAGRGKRCRDPLGTSMESISRDLLTQIIPVARKSPYALFGHSMGALLALLCTIKAQSCRVPLPQALFLSAAATPEIFMKTQENPISDLPPDQMWESLVGLNGIPECINMSMDFRKYLEPILYADFKALDTWNPSKFSPIPVPITVFLGDKDGMLTERKALKWRDFTTKKFSMRCFKGNHFYLQDHWSSLATHITDQLSQVA